MIEKFKNPLFCAVALSALALLAYLLPYLANVIPIASTGFSAISYDGMSQNKSISSPKKFKHIAPSSRVIDRRLELNFIFKAGKVNGYETLFQTTNFDNGLRAELNPNLDFTVILVKGGRVSAIRFGQIEPDRWYRFKLKFSSAGGNISVWLQPGKNEIPEGVSPKFIIAGFNLSTNNIIAGTGFSAKRPFSGQLHDFKLTARNYLMVPKWYANISIGFLVVATGFLLSMLILNLLNRPGTRMKDPTPHVQIVAALAFAGLFMILFADSIRIPLPAFKMNIPHFINDPDQGIKSEPIPFKIRSWPLDRYETNVEIQFSFRLAKQMPFQNLFQTDDFNDGIRVLFDGNGQSFVLIGAKNSAGYESYIMGYSAVNEWNSVKLVLKGSNLSCWAGDGFRTKVFSKTIAKLNMHNGRGALGCGDSCRLPFYGEIRNFSIVCRPFLKPFPAMFWQIFGSILLLFAMGFQIKRGWPSRWRERFNFMEAAIGPLLAVWATVLLASVNLGAVDYSEFLNVLFFCIAFSVVSWCFFSIVLLDFASASLANALFIPAFALFGHASSLLEKAGLQIEDKILLFFLCAGLFTAASVTLRFINRETLRKVMKTACIIISILIIFNTSKILLYEWGQFQNKDESRNHLLGSGVLSKNLPDIYQIVLDGYPNEWVLKNIYSFDNSQFLDELRKRGFLIASKSTSNYSFTLASLPSTLNMDYLNNDDDFASVQRKFKEGTVFRFLGKLGYKIVYINSYSQSFKSPENADVIVHQAYSKNFSNVMLKGSAWRIFLTFYSEMRHAIIFAFESTAACAVLPGPKFVIAHIMCPHPPFVFIPDGGIPPDTQGDYLMDVGSVHLNKTAFINQIKFTNKITIETIDTILKKSKNPPIMIIHGDHSLNLYEDPELNSGERMPDKSFLKTRMSILNAFLLPGVDVSSSPAYDSITPVNNFRIVFNYYLGTKFEILPDRNFYAPVDMFKKFKDVTDIVQLKADE